MIKHNISIMIFLFFSFSAQSQNMPGYGLELKVEVKCIDSQYYFIPHLKVTDNKLAIKIHKRLRYANEVDKTADCNFYLQKVINQNSFNIYVNQIRHPIPDQKYLEYKKFSFNDFLIDTVNISQFCPLDVGHYGIAVCLKYYVKGKESIICSDYYEFDVDFIPPRRR